MYIHTGIFHGLAWQQMRINKGHIRNLHDRAVCFAIVMLGLRAGAETLRALENPDDGNLYFQEKKQISSSFWAIYNIAPLDTALLHVYVSKISSDIVREIEYSLAKSTLEPDVLNNAYFEFYHVPLRALVQLSIMWELRFVIGRWAVNISILWVSGNAQHIVLPENGCSNWRHLDRHNARYWFLKTIVAIQAVSPLVHATQISEMYLYCCFWRCCE